MSTRQLGQHSFSHTVSVIEIIIQFSVTLVFLASWLDHRSANDREGAPLFTSFRYSQTEQDEGALARKDKPRVKTISVNRPEQIFESNQFDKEGESLTKRRGRRSGTKRGNSSLRVISGRLSTRNGSPMLCWWRKAMENGECVLILQIWTKPVQRILIPFQV